MQTQKAPHRKLERLPPAPIATVLLFRQGSLVQPKLLQTLGITCREAEVLSWVFEGKTNKDIEAILRISPRTVQKHLEHVYQKFAVETRTAAAGSAIRQLAYLQTPSRQHKSLLPRA